MVSYVEVRQCCTHIGDALVRFEVAFVLGHFQTSVALRTNFEESLHMTIEVLADNVRAGHPRIAMNVTWAQWTTRYSFLRDECMDIFLRSHISLISQHCPSCLPRQCVWNVLLAGLLLEEVSVH
jgi:hypothetical protein